MNQIKPWIQYAIDAAEGNIVTGHWVQLAAKQYLDYIDSDKYELRNDVVERAIDFIGLFKHYKGSAAGQPFRLEPWQMWVISAIVGVYKRGTNTRKHSSVYLEISRKNGKALDINTPIPTPEGWTTMGDLNVGDYVWGADGKPTKVTFATPIMYGHKCYEVTFSDGEKIVADADHNWYVKNRWWRTSRNPQRVMTTEEIFNSNWFAVRQDGKGMEYYFRVPVAQPLQQPDIELPVDHKRMEYKSIVDIKETESVPVRCITVDNADHLYCCGERYTVTHNTALCAALALYYLIADKMQGAELGALANSREQAKILYEFCDVWSRQIDPKRKDLKTYRDRIKFGATNSKLVVCSSADDKLDGGNYTCAIIDEFHAAKSNKLRDVIKSSMVRENSVLITITSAGFSTVGPCYKLRTTCTEILSGLKEDDSMFSAIYSLDEGDAWTDPSVWVKSTPNLGVTVTEEYIQRQVQSALNNPSEEVGVRTKTLNEWLQVSEVWIPDRYVIDCMRRLRLKDFRDCETYVGVDLSAVSDMTAVSYLIRREDDDRFYFYSDYYLPESCLSDSPNKEWYKYLKRQGLLHITSGNVVDYDCITADIMRNFDLLNIRKIGYDSWNAQSWAVDATEQGLPIEPYSQSIGNFNRPTKEFERLIRCKLAVIDSNETTTWMFRNVAIKRDANGNEKPNKGAGKDRKIDGVVSMIQALGVYLDTPRYTGTILVV